MTNVIKTQEINESVSQYKLTGDEQYFEKAFTLCKTVREGITKKFGNSRTDIPMEDFVSETNLVFNTLVDSYDASKGDFHKLLSSTLYNYLRNLIRDTDRASKLETTPQYRELDGEVVDILDAAIIEGVTKDDTIASDDSLMQSKTHSLLASLLDGISHDMRETVRVFLTTKDLTEAGAVLGISRTTVKRRLESLAKKYDASTFGAISDYLGTGGNEYVVK